MKAFQHFPSLPAFSRPETAQQDPCLRAQPRLNPAWEFYNKRQQVGECFSAQLHGNSTRDGRRTKGRDGLSWWTRRWDSAHTLPQLPIHLLLLPLGWSDGCLSYRMMWQFYDNLGRDFHHVIILFSYQPTVISDNPGLGEGGSAQRDRGEALNSPAFVSSGKCLNWPPGAVEEKVLD